MGEPAEGPDPGEFPARSRLLGSRIQTSHPFETREGVVTWTRDAMWAGVSMCRVVQMRVGAQDVEFASTVEECGHIVTGDRVRVEWAPHVPGAKWTKIG